MAGELIENLLQNQEVVVVVVVVEVVEKLAAMVLYSCQLGKTKDVLLPDE